MTNPIKDMEWIKDITREELRYYLCKHGGYINPDKMLRLIQDIYTQDFGMTVVILRGVPK